MQIDLRPASAADLEFCFNVTQRVMSDYVAQTWGNWDANAEKLKYVERFNPDLYRIIYVDQDRAGIVEVEESEDHVRLCTLYLLPQFQSRGIGSVVLGKVIDAAKDKPLRLRVLAVNARAQSFYLRHGFSIVESTPERIHMERRAQPAPSR